MGRPIKMLYTEFPCKGCADRQPACHDRCERYRQAKEKQVEISHKAYQEMRFETLNYTHRKNMRKR